MNPPLVSILIPCHNAGPWIRDTLESALTQTWPHREIIVVDDGSTDDSAAIVRTYGPRGVTLLSQPQAGQSAAFNTALAAARGDFFEFLDADDLLAPDKLECQLARLATLPPETVASGAWARFTDDPTQARFKPERVWQDFDPASWLVSSWEGGGMMHGAAWLVPAAVARRAGPWTASLSLINDFDYFARVLLASRGVAFCAEARTYYRTGSTSSLSHARSEAALRSAFDSLVRGTSALLAYEDSARTRHACAISFQRFVHSYYPQAPQILGAAERRVRELGGSQLAPTGGRGFRLLSRLVGWKLARRLQLLWFGGHR